MSDIEIKLDRLCNGMDVVKEKQEEMAEDIAKIKEAVYNPDQGLYAALEAWQATSSKMIWTLFTTVVGLVGAFILKSLG